MKPDVTVAPELAMRLLEELVYERVRKHVDLMELGWFESDLDDLIVRVVEELDEDGREETPTSVLAGALVDRAWHRVEAEWATHRRAAEECALCELDRRVRDEIRWGVAE